MRTNNPIGVFDSGLGGLTVVKELMRCLPNEDIVYFGDTARVPYGTKSKKAIIRFSQENTNVLLKHKVKMVVVACNSSSSYALASLKKKFSIPIVGVIDPGVQKAVETTCNKRVGVIATSATIASEAYDKGIQRQDKSVKVFSQSCPLFVPLVEQGWLNKKVTLEVAREYLGKLKRSGIDTLILGCTHYPLLKPALAKVMGKRVTLIDSAKEIALRVKYLLAESQQSRVCRGKRKSRYKFFVSDEPQSFQRIAKGFLGKDICINTRG